MVPVTSWCVTLYNHITTFYPSYICDIPSCIEVRNRNHLRYLACTGTKSPGSRTPSKPKHMAEAPRSLVGWGLNCPLFAPPFKWGFKMDILIWFMPMNFMNSGFSLFLKFYFQSQQLKALLPTIHQRFDLRTWRQRTLAQRCRLRSGKLSHNELERSTHFEDGRGLTGALESDSPAHLITDSPAHRIQTHPHKIQTHLRTWHLEREKPTFRFIN